MADEQEQVRFDDQKICELCVFEILLMLLHIKMFKLTNQLFRISLNSQYSFILNVFS